MDKLLGTFSSDEWKLNNYLQRNPTIMQQNSERPVQLKSLRTEIMFQQQN